MNVAGWRQRAVTARLRGNHFPLPLWTADSELKGGLRRLLKSHLRAAVVITLITTSRRWSGGVTRGDSPSERKIENNL